MGNHFTTSTCCRKIWSFICCCCCSSNNNNNKAQARSQNGSYLLKGRVHPISRIEKWEEKIAEANSNGKILVVNFKASWCLPCRKIAPIYQELASTYTSMIFVTIDVDELAISKRKINLVFLRMISKFEGFKICVLNIKTKQEFSNEWNVEATPTIVFLKNGKQMDKLVGGDAAELQKKTAAAADLL